MEKREIVWKHDARRAECFHTISSFSNFHEDKILKLDIIEMILTIITCMLLQIFL